MQLPNLNRYSSSYSQLSDGYHVVFNTESMFLYLTDPEYRKVVSHAASLTCDGIGVAFAYACRGQRLRRYHGPDLFEDALFDRSRLHVVIGGSDEAQRCLREKVARRDPRIEINFYGGKLKQPQLQNIAASLLKKGNKPMNVYLCLGINKQERAARDFFEAGVRGKIMGVGAAVDFHSGTKKRAAPIWRRLGLEWLPRLVREPRMIPRVGRSFVGAAFFIFIGGVEK